MGDITRMILVLLFILSATANAAAQSGRISLNPVLKPGHETRYVINASVATNVSPTGTNGIATSVHRETRATVLLRAVDSERGLMNEAVVEAIETRTTVDGVDRPVGGSALVGQKITYRVDSLGRLLYASYPPSTGETGLAGLIFSLSRWVPGSEVAVGQTWGQGSAGESVVGDYGYISTNGLSDVVSGATLSYKLSQVEGDTALVEGTIGLKQSGTALLTTKEGRLNVNVIATGTGNARVEYDLAGSRVIAATTETSLEGRLANIPPGREGKKLKREGSVVETARFSIKLIQ